MTDETDSKPSEMELGVLLELEIEEDFEKGIREQSKMGSEGRAPGFHVSGLSYDCKRNIQYSVMASDKETSNHEEGEEMDSEGLYRTWIGTQLHLTPITKKHETHVHTEMDVDGQIAVLNGHIDEIKDMPDGSSVIIDKKFVGRFPKEPYDHHVRQVSIYAGLYSRQTGIPVKYGALVYFMPYILPVKGTKRMEVFVFPVDGEGALKTAEEKIRAVQKAINEGKVIERTTGWLCRYCKWRTNCEALDGPVEGAKT